MTEAIDEQFHTVGDDPTWQESFLFNWADADTFGLCRLGWRANEAKADALLATIRHGRCDFIYAAIGRGFDPATLDTPADAGLRVGAITIRMLEPLEKWELDLHDGRMHLEWTATTPVFDFVDQYGALYGTGSHQHFEQCGTATGWTNFRGTRHEIDGTGTRDKSWGARDWRTLEGWNWITAVCGPDFAFEATQIVAGAHPHPMGFVFYEGTNHPLVEVDVEFTWGRTKHRFDTARILLRDAEAETFEISARARGHIPMFMRGAWIQESMADFTVVDGPGQIHTSSGHGVVEHVYRPGVLEAVTRLPEFVDPVRAALSPI